MSVDLPNDDFPPTRDAALARMGAFNPEAHARAKDLPRFAAARWCPSRPVGVWHL